MEVDYYKEIDCLWKKNKSPQITQIITDNIMKK